MENTKDARAYPIAINGQAHDEWHYGLTKRELIAAMAMQGLLSNPEGGKSEGGGRVFSPYEISRLSLLHADALLEQLNKG